MYILFLPLSISNVYIIIYRLITADVASLDSIATISKLRVLYNNYELDTMVNEYVTPNERKEENEFIDAVLGTSLMRHMMLFLSDKGNMYKI